MSMNLKIVGAVFFLFVSTFLSVTSLVYSATNDFTVGTLVGGDSTPPTIPGSVIATPVATSQIDLTWSTSTDNFYFSGYHVWRDGVQVATTSSLLYSDVGLTASTTYFYYVTAYDSSFNESASSTVVSTTTLPIPPPAPPTPTSTPTSTSSHTGTKLSPFDEMILSIEVLPQKSTAVIRYFTKAHIRAVLRWGKTTSFEMGSIAENIFSKTHETRIMGLQPNTKYFFTIEGEDGSKRNGTLYNGVFTTLLPVDTFAPGNVSYFSAQKDSDDILLSWKNPSDPDFAKVRILESELFYPSDTADGWVVYEGDGEYAKSKGKALPGTTHYYTLFTYDALGNISSGAVTFLKVADDGKVSTDAPAEIIDPSLNVINFTFQKLHFMQDGEVVPIDGDTIYIDGSKQLTISIPYDALPMHLKTILVVLKNEAEPEKKFSFLIRTNDAKTEYTATLAPLGVSGKFPVQVSIFDFKTAQVGYADGTIITRIRSLHLDSPRISFLGYVLNLASKIGFSPVTWFVGALIALAFMSRRLIRMQL